MTAPRGTAAPPSHSLLFSEFLDLFVCWLFLELHSERGTASTVDMRHHYREAPLSELSAPPRLSSGEILGFEFKYCLLNNLVLDFRFEFKYCLLFQGGYGIQGGKNSHVRGNLSSATRYLFPFPIPNLSHFIFGKSCCNWVANLFSVHLLRAHNGLKWCDLMLCSFSASCVVFLFLFRSSSFQDPIPHFF